MHSLPTLPASWTLGVSLCIAAAAAASEVSVEWMRPRALPAFAEGGVSTLTLRIGNHGEAPVALLRVRGGGALDQPLDLTEPREGALVHDAAADCYVLDPDQLIVSHVRSGVLMPGEDVTFTVQLRLPPARRESMPGGGPGQSGAAPAMVSWVLTTGVAVETIDIVAGQDAGVYMAPGEHDRTEPGRWLPLTAEILAMQRAFPPLSRTFVLRDENTATSTTRLDLELPCTGSRMNRAVAAAAKAGQTPFWSERFDAWLAASGDGDGDAIVVPLANRTAPELPSGWSFAALLFAEALAHAPVPVLTPGRSELFRALLLSHQLGMDDLSLLYADDFDAFCILVAQHGLRVTAVQEPLRTLVVR